MSKTGSVIIHAARISKRSPNKKDEKTFEKLYSGVWKCKKNMILNTVMINNKINTREIHHFVREENRSTLNILSLKISDD